MGCWRLVVITGEDGKLINQWKSLEGSRDDRRIRRRHIAGENTRLDLGLIAPAGLNVRETSILLALLNWGGQRPGQQRHTSRRRFE